MDKFEVQTRSETMGLCTFSTLKDAIKFATGDESVWKISFGLPSGERMRFVRRDSEWVYEALFLEKFD